MAFRELGKNEHLIFEDDQPQSNNRFREISPDELVLEEENHIEKQLIPQSDSLPSSGLIGKTGDVLSDLSLSAGAGAVDLGNSAINLGVLYGQVDPTQAADWIDSSNQVKTNIESGISPYAQQQMENIAGADGFWDTTKEVVKNPYGTLNLTARNLSNSLPSMATAGAGAAGGAAVGTAIAPGVGTVIGGAFGAVGGGFAGSAPIEIGSWVEQALQERGADLSTKEGRIAAYSNKILMDDIRGEAERKGLTTAAVDSVWNLFAGSKLAKTVGKPLPTRILAGAKDTGIQMAGGMASEAAGQTAAYKGDLSKVSGSDIALEGLLEAPSSIGEVAIGSMIRNKAQQEGLSGRGDPPPPDNGAPTQPTEPPAPAAPPVPNRDDLARMLNPDANPTTAKNAVVQPETVRPTIAGTPEIGDTIEHVDQNGDVIKGKIDSIQEGENGQRTIIVTDAQGNQNIVFDGEGETRITDRRPLNRDDLLSEIKRGQPKEDVAPQAETQPLIEPDIAPQETPIAVQKQSKADNIENVQAIIDNIRAQAKMSGWNGMLMRREQEALNQLSTLKQAEINEAALGDNPEFSEPIGNASMRNSENSTNLPQRLSLFEQDGGGINVPSELPITGRKINTSNFKSPPNIPVINPDNTANIRDAEAVFTKGFGSLNVPQKLRVLNSMILAAKDDKILRSIISSIPVDMVDNLMGSKFSPQDPLHNGSVFIDSLALSANLPVFADAIDSAISSPAFPIAEVFGPDALTLRSKKFTRTEVTNKDIRHGIDNNHYEENVNSKETGDTKKPLIYQEPAPQPAETQEVKPKSVTPKPNTSSPIKGEVGMMLSSGQVATTASGRTTTPFPKFSTETPRKTSHAVKNVENWLMQNALAEANARGDEFNALQFQANMKKPSQADKDSAEYYLFGDTQPQVQKSIFKEQKPVVTSKSETTIEKPVVAENATTAGWTIERTQDGLSGKAKKRGEQKYKIKDASGKTIESDITHKDKSDAVLIKQAHDKYTAKQARIAQEESDKKAFTDKYGDRPISEIISDHPELLDGVSSNVKKYIPEALDNESDDASVDDIIRLAKSYSESEKENQERIEQEQYEKKQREEEGELLQSISDKITTFLDGKGDAIRYSEHGSKLSRSGYIEIDINPIYEDGDIVDNKDSVKVRISDHVLPPTYGRDNGYADFEFGIRNQYDPEFHGADPQPLFDYIDKKIEQSKPVSAENATTQEVSLLEEDYNGVRLYQIKVRNPNDDDSPSIMWGVESQDNKGRREKGERAGMGDTLHSTLDEAKKQADFDVSQREDAAKRDALNASKKKEEENKTAAIKADTYNGFLDGKPENTKSLIRKALSKQYNFTDGGGVMTVRERIEKFNDNGTLKISTLEENKIKPMSKMQFHRADQKQQDAHEARVKEAGKKTTYLVNESELGKIGYDYAEHLLNQKSKQNQETTPANETAETKASEPENVPKTPVSGPQDQEQETEYGRDLGKDIKKGFLVSGFAKMNGETIISATKKDETFGIKTRFYNEEGTQIFGMQTYSGNPEDVVKLFDNITDYKPVQTTTEPQESAPISEKKRLILTRENVEKVLNAVTNNWRFSNAADGHIQIAPQNNLDGWKDDERKSITSAIQGVGLRIADGAVKSSGRYIDDNKSAKNIIRVTHGDNQFAPETFIDSYVSGLKRFSETETMPDIIETPAEKPKDTIEDFGEKIAGAKKDLWKDYAKSIGDELPDDLKDITLSKHFPEPNYEVMIANGVTTDVLAAIKAMRDIIPSKPQKSWKLKEWASKVKTVRELSKMMLDDKLSLSQIKEKMGEYSRSLSGLAKTMELYSALGYPAFTKAKGWSVRESRISKRIDGEIQDIGNRWMAASGEEFGTDFDTKEQAIDYIRSKLSIEETTKGKKPTTFDVYRITKTGELVIGKKIAAGKFINLKGGFKTGNEARLYMAENGDELVALYEKKKEVPPERRSTNDPRKGEDYRKGEDVSVETLAKTFGFRGIQFGNYVEQKRRAADINNAYDAMKDMAAILGLPENALSLEGTLGLAFGARGGGNFAAAHYERGQTVINLTKKSGAGSLAHEWFHAMDHHFGKRRDGKDVYITESAYIPTKEIRKEVTDAFSDIVKAIKKTGVVQRSESIDKTRTKDYWSTDIEMAARSFEAYIIYKAGQKEASNDYLANVVGEDAWNASRDESKDNSSYPYPTDKEMSETIAPAFDKLFEVLETKDTDKGAVMFSLSSDYEPSKTISKNAANEIIGKIVADLNTQAKKLGLPENSAVIFENISDVKNVPNLEKASQDGGVVEGFYYKNLIYIAMTAKDYISTLNHEAVHYLKAAGAFTQAEWDTLLEKAPKWREKYNIQKNYGDLNLTESKLDEEAIAHALQDYSNQGILTRIRNKIIKYFNMVKNVVTGKGFNYKTPEALFDDIMSGEIGRRRFDPDYDTSALFSIKPAEKTNTPAFKKWFGDSKVVDADGKPLVVYHGTPSDFDTFKRQEEQVSGSYHGNGFYFSESAGEASDYSLMDEGSNVMPVYLSINKPFDKSVGQNFNLSDKELADIAQEARMEISDVLDEVSSQGVFTFSDAQWFNKRRRDNGVDVAQWYTDTIKQHGFDGIKVGEGEWVAFDPTQIKSVNNRGTFDANDERIMFSRKVMADDGLPLFSILGKKNGKKRNKEEQLQDAIESLDARGLADKLRPSISKIASYILHPHQIASLYESFTPVYLGAIEMMKMRDVLVHKLSKNVHLYNKINKKSKAKIDAVLEIGRLSKTNFKPNEDGLIVVKNEGLKDTVWSKDGDEITLSDVEVSAYEGVRAAMDLSLDVQIQTTLEEYGFADMGIKTKKDLIAALAKEGEKELKSPSTIRQMQDAIKIIKDIEDKKRKGYIPFKRWGEIGIVVRSKGEDAELKHFERVEIPSLTVFGRKQVVGENKAVIEAVKRLREKYPSKDFAIHPFEMKDFSKLKADINLTDLDVLKASSEMTEEEWDSIRGMLSEAVQRRGYKQHFLQSNDVSGYSADFERAINDYIVSVSGHLSRRVHKPKLDAAISQIEKKGEASLFEYARKYVSYITDPVEEWSAMRQAVYFWYLAGNVASGVTNSTQPLMVTAPWFKAMFSHGQIAKQMSRAYKDTVSLVTLNNGTDVFDFDKAPDDVRDALIRAEAEGDFLPKNTHDAMAIADSNSSSMRGAGRRWRQVMDVTSLTFSVPERANRVVTYISAYRFAIQPENKAKIMAFINRDQIGRAMLAGKSGSEFAEAFAHYAVISTQLRMGKLNRPTLSRGVGTLPFQFMSFSLQMLELMHRLAKVHGGKSATSIGIMLFAVVAMAGIKGIPFEDDLQKLFESAYKTMTRTDIDIDSEMLKLLTKYVGKTAAQAIVKGAPYAIANLDMSARLGYGNISPDNQSDLLGVWFDMFWTKPVQASKDLARGEVLQAVADIMPAMIRNVVQGYLWSEEGVKSAATGDTIIPPEDITKSDVGLKMLGFTSSSIAGERSRIYAEKRASTAVNELRSDYYDRLARAHAGRIRASRERDKEAMSRYGDEIESITIEKNTHNEDAPIHKQITINNKTLKQRINEELEGAKSNKPRKQARQEAEELKKVWGN